MNLSAGSAELPRRPGEGFLEYLERYARFKGYLSGAAGQAVKAMPEASREVGEDDE